MIDPLLVSKLLSRIQESKLRCSHLTETLSDIHHVAGGLIITSKSNPGQGVINEHMIGKHLPPLDSLRMPTIVLPNDIILLLKTPHDSYYSHPSSSGDDDYKESDDHVVITLYYVVDRYNYIPGVTRANDFIKFATRDKLMRCLASAVMSAGDKLQLIKIKLAKLLKVNAQELNTTSVDAAFDAEKGAIARLIFSNADFGNEVLHDLQNNIVFGIGTDIVFGAVLSHDGNLLDINYQFTFK